MDGNNAAGGQQPPMRRYDWRFTLWYLFFALLALAWTRDLWEGRRVEPVAYSEFVQHLKDGRVESVIVSSKLIEGKLKAPLPDGRTHIVANRVDPAVANDLAAHGVPFRAATENTFLGGELSTGAADDLAKASELALEMVTRFGMADEVGQVAYERPRSPFLDAAGQLHAERPHSEATARSIDQAVRRLIDQAFERARSILAQRRDLLDEGAALLLAKETLTEAELAPLASRAAQ